MRRDAEKENIKVYVTRNFDLEAAFQSAPLYDTNVL
jgi:hypothetical protein